MNAGAAKARFWGIVPAAGLGRRMGTAKQALPYNQSTMAGTVTRTLLAAGLDAVVVVTRTELRDALDLPADARVLLAFNDDTKSEMIDSIRIGLSLLDQPGGVAGAAPTVGDGVLVIPADMPEIRAATHRACMAAFARHPSRLVIGAHNGRRGHPLIFPFSLRPEVERLEGGLRTLLTRHEERIVVVDTNDPGVTRDIDTPQDYEERNL